MKRPVLKKTAFFILCLLLIISSVLACSKNTFSIGRAISTRTSTPAASSASNAVIPDPLYGVTVDDCFNCAESEIVSALSNMSVKPTVRIVFDSSKPASSYVSLTQSIHTVAYVLGCVYDSTAEKEASLDAHNKRWVDYVQTLGSNVDIWEVGNEVNGEDWLGDDPQLLSDKFYSAYKYCKFLGLKTELTAYQFRPGDQSLTMNEWLQKYIPDDMKAGLDYVLVSYYDDDNEDYQWDWAKVTSDLHTMFPNSKTGIGECGFTGPHAADTAFYNRVDAYYRMPQYDSSYVGGYFWWNWAEDCVPYLNNPGWKRINDGCIWMENHYK